MASPGPAQATHARWRLLEAEAGVYGTNSSAADTLMNQAQQMNITVLRIFATGVTPQLPLKLNPSEAGCGRRATEAIPQPAKLDMLASSVNIVFPTHAAVDV